MKYIIPILFCLISTNISIGQDRESEISMTSDYSSTNSEIRDILQFEGIEYLKLKFYDQELQNKSYKLSVKEIWDGVIIRETTVFDSKSVSIKRFQTVGDSILSFKVMSKFTQDNKLKMTFKFPRFSVTKNFEAIESDDYSLRNIAEESNMKIRYGEQFSLLAYILPYEREDGSKSWCDIGTSGDDIENWGERFGIKHYLLFEMIFD